MRTSLALAILSAGAIATPASAAGPAPVPGKYGCTESVYSVSDGTFTFEPRGFIRLFADGTYQQNVSKDRGTWRFKNGTTKLKGGSLAGSSAKAVDGNAKRFHLTVKFETSRDATWTCSRTGKA